MEMLLICSLNFPTLHRLRSLFEGKVAHLNPIWGLGCFFFLNPLKPPSPVSFSLLLMKLTWLGDKSLPIQRKFLIRQKPSAIWPSPVTEKQDRRSPKCTFWSVQSPLAPSLSFPAQSNALVVSLHHNLCPARSKAKQSLVLLDRKNRTSSLQKCKHG